MTEQYRLLSGDEVIELLGELLDRLAGRGIEVLRRADAWRTQHLHLS